MLLISKKSSNFAVHFFVSFEIVCHHMCRDYIFLYLKIIFFLCTCDHTFESK